MKKLSLLIALFMCLTIGGVYATWTYAGTEDIADAFAETKVTIADAELTGANGVYKIESNLVLTVDQANEHHEAELKFASNNSQPIHLTITFTPAVNAPVEIKKNGVPSELYFGTTVPMQYRMDGDGNFSATGTPVDIFTFSNVANGDLDNIFTWTKNGEDENGFCTSFTYTLDEDDLKAMIQLSQTFVLDTKYEHDVFGGHTEFELGGSMVKEGLIGNIIARVTDGTVN